MEKKIKTLKIALEYDLKQEALVEKLNLSTEELIILYDILKLERRLVLLDLNLKK